MPSPRILDLIGDAVNPIVVKELKQALQSRFLVAVLLLFLLVQMLFLGIYLMVRSLDGSLDAADFEGGRMVFSFLNWILLATCMLFIPAYSGFRLAAERSEVHVDLLFIGALSPRTILSGKVAAAQILALLIFSACAPFMTFTYFLRGIDLPSIFVVIGFDFLEVMAIVTLALFLAIVPANRVFKVLLGLLGLVFGLALYMVTIGLIYNLLDSGLLASMDNLDFWAVCLAVVLETLGCILFLFVCSVGLLSPPSANRSLPLRVGVSLFCLGTGVPLALCAHWIGSDWPIQVWIGSASIVLSLCLLIAVNEREQWTPRVARTIPRRWWLRLVAFLFYSGAAGGVLWACLLFAGCWLALPMQAAGWLTAPPRMGALENVWTTLRVTTAIFAYTYCYALTAVFLRNTLIKIQPVYTWILALSLTAHWQCLALPGDFPHSFQRMDSFESLSVVADESHRRHPTGQRTQPGGAGAAVAYLSCWAAVVTLLNSLWFIRQMRRFHPGATGADSVGASVPTNVSAGSMDVTKTIP